MPASGTTQRHYNLGLFKFYPGNTVKKPELIEACSLNVPVVLRSCTGLDVYVKEYDSGIVLENNTAREVESYFNTDTWKRKGMNDRLMVEKEFDWDKIAESLYIVYNSGGRNYCQDI